MQANQNVENEVCLLHIIVIMGLGMFLFIALKPCSRTKSEFASCLRVFGIYNTNLTKKPFTSVAMDVAMGVIYELSVYAIYVRE